MTTGVKITDIARDSSGVSDNDLFLTVNYDSGENAPATSTVTGAQLKAFIGTGTPGSFSPDKIQIESGSPLTRRVVGDTVYLGSSGTFGSGTFDPNNIIGELPITTTVSGTSVTIGFSGQSGSSNFGANSIVTTGIVTSTATNGSLTIGGALTAGIGIDTSGSTISTKESKINYETINAYSDDTDEIPINTLVALDNDFIITDNNISYVGVRSDVGSADTLGPPAGITILALPAGDQGKEEAAVLTRGIFNLDVNAFSLTLTPNAKIYLVETVENNRKKWVFSTTIHATNRTILVGHALQGAGGNNYSVHLDFETARHAGSTDEIIEGSNEYFTATRARTANPVDGSTIERNASNQLQVKDDGITKSHLADDSVTTSAIADDAVTQPAIADDAVGIAQLKTRNTGTNGQVLVKYSDTELEYQDKGSSQGSAGEGGWSRKTLVSTTSGTSHTIDGISANARIVKIVLDDIQVSTGNRLKIRLGTSSAIKTSGYDGKYTIGNNLAETSATDGFYVNIANDITDGIIELVNITGNKWIISGVSGSSDRFLLSGGSVELDGALDQINLTLVDTSNPFTSGSFNILYSDNVTGTTPADYSVTEDKVANNAITTIKVEDDAITPAKLNANNDPSTGDIYVVGANANVATWIGSATFATSDSLTTISGSVTTNSSDISTIENNLNNFASHANSNASTLASDINTIETSLNNFASHANSNAGAIVVTIGSQQTQIDGTFSNVATNANNISALNSNSFPASVSNPSDGDLLVYNSTNSRYENTKALGESLAAGTIGSREIGNNGVLRNAIGSNAYADINDARVGTATNLIINPDVLTDWHEDQHKRDTFTGYNKTSNATVAIGEYKISGNTITVRPKTDDVNIMNGATFRDQLFTAENSDRTSIYSVFISAKTFSENIITLTIITTPANRDLESSSLGDNTTIYIEGEDRYNSRQDAYSFSSSGGNVNFANTAEVIAGTVTDKAIAPDTAHDLVEHLAHTATYTGFQNQATINADENNLALGTWHINSTGTLAYFRGHDTTEAARMLTEFLVDRSCNLKNATNQRLYFDFTTVTTINVSGSGINIIKCAITKHEAVPNNPTLTGDWSISISPEQNRQILANAPPGVIPIAALAMIPGGQLKTLSASGNSNIGSRLGTVSDTVWNNSLVATNTNLLPIPHPNQSTTPTGTGEISFTPRSATSTFFAIANVGFGWLSGSESVQLHFLLARKIGNGSWTIIPGAKLYNVLNGNYGNVDFNVTPVMADAPNTTQEVTYRVMIVRGNTGRIYPISQTVLMGEVPNL